MAYFSTRPISYERYTLSIKVNFDLLLYTAQRNTSPHSMISSAPDDISFPLLLILPHPTILKFSWNDWYRPTFCANLFHRKNKFHLTIKMYLENADNTRDARDPIRALLSVQALDMMGFRRPKGGGGTVGQQADIWSGKFFSGFVWN